MPDKPTSLLKEIPQPPRGQIAKPEMPPTPQPIPDKPRNDDYSLFKPKKG